MLGRYFLIFLVVAWLPPGTESLCAQDTRDLDELLEAPLSELMQVEGSLASGIEESIIDAPAAMVVVTAEDIRLRGYTNLAEIIVDLPGFDTVLANGIPYLYAYQRGYRHPGTQRTLLMIDGQVDNHLWTHQAIFSRRFLLSSISRIEVLYGTASAIYGPNAFLGIVNIVTNQGTEVADREVESNVNFHGGSYKSRGVDAAVRGKVGDLTFSASGRVFRSDEPDLSGDFGFISNDMLCEYEHLGTPTGVGAPEPQVRNLF
jgi:outer membrane receptor for ferrienterochelin and colicins